MRPKQIPQRPKEDAVRRQGEGQAEEDMKIGKPKVANDETEAEDESSDDESSLFMLSKKNTKKRQRAPSTRNQVFSTMTSTNPNCTQSTLPKAYTPEPTVAEAPIEPDAPKSTPSGPMATQTTAPAATPPLPSSKANAAAAEDDEEPELFSLDADDEDVSLQKAISAKNGPKKHLPEEPEEPEEPEQNQKTDEQEGIFKPNAPIPASPPISMPIRPTSGTPPKVLPMPQGSIPKVSIGSLGGRPLIMSPVKDPELLERIRQSDDAVPFWVGSIHGRSGVDASNVKSYVASLPSPKGMPESFFERYIRERDTGTKYASDKEDSEGKT